MPINLTTLLIIFAFHICLADQQPQCSSWSNIEQELKHASKQVNCTIMKNCTGISCSIYEYLEKGINGGLYINSCENPPNIMLEIDVPELNIKKWQKKFTHGDKFRLSDTFEGVFEMTKENDKYFLGLVLDMTSGIKSDSPLASLVPLLKPSGQFHIFHNVSIDIPHCLTSNVSNEMSISGTAISSTVFPHFISESNVQSNCSILNSSCAINEICHQINASSLDGVCICVMDYVRDKDGKCIYNPPIIPSTEVPGGHSEPRKKTSNTSLLLTAILVPIVVIVLAVVLVYMTIRFRVFQHLRRRLRVQVYEHVLLGQDDENDDDDETLNPVV